MEYLSAYLQTDRLYVYSKKTGLCILKFKLSSCVLAPILKVHRILIDAFSPQNVLILIKIANVGGM